MIIRHDRDDCAYRELARDYPAVCCLNSPQAAKGTGMLIHPRFVLTAAHGATKLPRGRDILVADSPYPISRIIPHQSWQHRPPRPRQANTAGFTDLALLELERPVASIKPLPLYEQGAEEGQVVTLVGKGAFGTGLSGPQQQDGRWRAATNRVEAILHNTWLILRFDEPWQATELEGVGGPGDSGGIALIDQAGLAHVAGIASWEDSSEAGGRYLYGVYKHYVRTSAFLPWITSTINAS